MNLNILKKRLINLNTLNSVKDSIKRMKRDAQEGEDICYIIINKVKY